MPQLKLTTRSIEALPSPSSGQVDYWDTLLPGFGLRVSQGGRKTFVAMYRWRGKKQRDCLGRWPIHSLADAREKAAAIFRDIESGLDPRRRKHEVKNSSTMKELIEAYIERHAKVNKRSWHKDRQYLDYNIVPKLGDRLICDISRREIMAVIEEVATRAPVTANRTLEVVRKMFNWAKNVEEGGVKENPVAGTGKVTKEQKRERVLREDEFYVVWGSFDILEPRGRAAMRLLALTAQREMEVLGMHWRELNLEERWWTIPPERAKNGKSHRVYLCKAAVAELEMLAKMYGDEGYLFPQTDPRKSVARSWIERRMGWVRDECQFSNWTVHDLRRTAASYMASKGVPRLHIDKLLNHVEKGVGAVYDRHAYDRAKMRAATIWGNWVARLMKDNELLEAVPALDEDHGADAA